MMWNAYRGDCFCGCGTKFNRVAYAAFGILVALAIALIIPGGLIVDGCPRYAQDCLKPCHMWCSSTIVENVLGDLSCVTPSNSQGYVSAKNTAIGRQNSNVADVAGWQAFCQNHLSATTAPIGRLDATSRDNFQRLYSWVNGNQGGCLYGDTFDFHDLMDVSFNDFYNNDFDKEAATLKLMEKIGSDANKVATYTWETADGGSRGPGLDYYRLAEPSTVKCDFLNYYKYNDHSGNPVNAFTTGRSCCETCELKFNGCRNIGNTLFIVGWTALAAAAIPWIFMCFFSPDPRKTGAVSQ